MNLRMRLEVLRYNTIKRLDAFDWWPSGCVDKRSCHEHRSVYFLRRYPFVKIGLLCISLIDLGPRPCPVCGRIYPPFHPNCRCVLDMSHLVVDMGEVDPEKIGWGKWTAEDTEINLEGTFDKP